MNPAQHISKFLAWVGIGQSRHIELLRDQLKSQRQDFQMELHAQQMQFETEKRVLESKIEELMSELESAKRDASDKNEFAHEKMSESCGIQIELHRCQEALDRFKSDNADLRKQLEERR